MTQTTVLIFLYALSASVLPAQVGMDLSSFSGGWNCYMDRRGAAGNGESSTRQCSSPDAGLTIRRTSAHGAVLAPLHPRMYETSMRVVIGVTFWVDGGEMMRYGPRGDIEGLTEIRLVPELAAALKTGLKARIQVFNARGTYFEYTASLTAFTKAYDYIQRPFRQ